MFRPKKKTSTGKIRSKKVTIDGITFDSTLEGHMYTLLKEAGIKFTYEGKSYPLVDKFTYPAECYEKPATGKDKTFKDRREVRKMIYTPDFIGEQEQWIIETKGRANESFPLRWKIFKESMLQRDNPPMLFKPSNQAECREVVRILKQKGYGMSQG